MTQVSPVCYRHPNRETYVRCSRCDRPICPDCMTPAAVGHQCPECVADGRRQQRPVRTVFGGTAGAGSRGYVTISIIVICCVLLLASALSATNVGSALAGNSVGGLFGGITPLMAKLGVIGEVQTGPHQMVPYGVADGQYYRLVTGMFMHYGIIHLAVNMWSLWILGRPLEAMLGPVRFGALYLLAGIGGNVAAYVFSPEALSAGASTAIFGLFGALYIVMRKLGQNAQQLIPLLVINLILTFSVSGISKAGHIGGLVVGTLVALGIAHAPRANRTAVQSAVIGGAFVILAAISLWETARLT